MGWEKSGLLDSIEGSALFGKKMFFSRCERRKTGGVGAVGRIAHEAIEKSPGGTEDIWRWAEGRLFECQVGFLGFSRCEGC